MAERTEGLAGVKCLRDNQGMLFVFNSSERHGIWMKNMSISIDILWLNTEKQVVYIERNVGPETYPTIFRPDNNSQYVLEMSAGNASRLGIMVGDRLTW